MAVTPMKFARPSGQTSGIEVKSRPALGGMQLPIKARPESGAAMGRDHGTYGDNTPIHDPKASPPMPPMRGAAISPAVGRMGR